ncbi:MAG TPA: non-homologous end-joining DNA ligase [Chloroflexota bacterium]|nr:non-homologous end-joining DNA ligase [Chloroflexota bacterium]
MASPKSTDGASPITVRGVRVTNPNKVLFPEDGLTKLDLVHYYEAMAPIILKYVRHRPLTLRPFMSGIGGRGIYLKNAPKGAPSWLRTFADVAESTGETVNFVVAEGIKTLIWVAQYNSIELHAWLSTVDRPDLPDWAVVDLDPPDEVPPAKRRRVAAKIALLVRDQLERYGLKSFPKPSGQTGVHVLVPLAPVHPFDDVRAFFEKLGVELCREHEDWVTTDYDVADRHGRILIDYAQNSRGKTTVAPYSVRPKPGAPVALPMTWAELEEWSKSKKQPSLRDVPTLVEKRGDALAPALKLKQKLPREKRRAA